jgi:hypothetical protein
MREEKLDRLLGFLEENIDLDHVKTVEEITVKSITFNDVPYLPLTVLYSEEGGFIPYPYSETFDNPEKMLYNELISGIGSVYRSVKLKDDYPLQIRSNHGIGIIPSLFGAKSRIVNDNMPWVDHLSGMKEARKAILNGIPDLETGLAGRVIKTLKYFNDRLEEYPKCYNAIRITQPDMQGPFDIAHLLLGTEVFFEVYDNPNDLHELLELITQTYIAYRKDIDKLLTDNAGNVAVYVHGSIFGGKVLLKDDTAAINLSKDMYEEFSGQYNKKILSAFDSGGSIHSCGRLKDWYFDVMYRENLRGINYGNPELQDFEPINEFWLKRSVPVIWWGYNQDYKFLNEIFEMGIRTGMTLACSVENFDKAQEILKRYRERGS